MTAWRAHKLWLKAQLMRVRAWLVRTFVSYDASQLLGALRLLGIQPGDAVMLHSAYKNARGFRGSVEQLIDVFIEAVGPEGHLLMVSLPYRTSTLEYLKSSRVFDVRRTPSMMGLVSEMFRRRGDVVRSLHPTHPVLVRGPRAAAFVEAHSQCRWPCGPESPFDRLAAADGKVVFFDVAFANFTFFHHLEHLVGPRLGFPLYTADTFQVPVIDESGVQRTVETYAYSTDALRRRRFEVLEAALRQRGLIERRRIGTTKIEMIRVRDAVRCVLEMADEGRFFYDLSGLDAAPRPDGANGAAPRN